MTTCCPFSALSTDLRLFSMEAMCPISMFICEGIQIGLPICQVDSLKKPNKFCAFPNFHLPVLTEGG